MISFTFNKMDKIVVQRGVMVMGTSMLANKTEMTKYLGPPLPDGDHPRVASFKGQPSHVNSVAYSGLHSHEKKSDSYLMLV